MPPGFDPSGIWAALFYFVAALGSVADWIAVALLGAIVGVTNLMARHRDAPGRALVTTAAIFYIAINASASLVALALGRAFGWVGSGDPTAAGNGTYWVGVLVAGLGAMALLRSSFSLGTGDNSVSVNLSTYLQRFLDAADDGVSRVRGKVRSETIQRVVSAQHVSFALARIALPATCFALVHHISPEDEVAFGEEVDELDGRADLNDRVKARLLGLLLLDLVGEGVLTAAIRDLGADIQAIPEPEVPDPPD